MRSRSRRKRRTEFPFARLQGYLLPGRRPGAFSLAFCPRADPPGRARRPAAPRVALSHGSPRAGISWPGGLPAPSSALRPPAALRSLARATPAHRGGQRLPRRRSRPWSRARIHAAPLEVHEDARDHRVLGHEALMFRISPPQRGHTSTSTANTIRSSSAQRRHLVWGAGHGSASCCVLFRNETSPLLSPHETEPHGHAVHAVRAVLRRVVVCRRGAGRPRRSNEAGGHGAGDRGR